MRLYQAVHKTREKGAEINEIFKTVFVEETETYATF
jgi:hypothetical protein